MRFSRRRYNGFHPPRRLSLEDRSRKVRFNGTKRILCANIDGRNSSFRGEEILIRTVTGDVATIAGRILAHEHLQIDLSAQKGSNNVIGKAEEPDVIDDLRKAKEHGLAAIVDLSAPGWGRDPIALRRISERAGIAVVCATGFYWDPFPDIVIKGSVKELRDAMIAEITEGIGPTGIRCGVIK